MHHSEKGNVRSDSEAHYQNGEDGKAGRADKSTYAKSNVTEKHFETVPTPRIAGLVAKRRGVAEAAQSRTARLIGVHAGGLILRDLLVKVELQLILQLLAGAAATVRPVRVVRYAQTDPEATP